MKKSLVALATLAATGAFAQSSVTLYGTLDAGVASFKNVGTAGAQMRCAAGTSRGKADLTWMGFGVSHQLSHVVDR